MYHNDRHRPTDRSNIPSIVKAPLLTPGTYDAETLLRQRARSLSSASAEEEAKWVASGGENARLSALNRERDELGATSPDSDGGESDTRDYFGRAPRVGVDGALGLADTDVESGTESGRDSPVQRFGQLKGSSRRRGLSGGLNFTPVSQDPPQFNAAEPVTPTRTSNAEYSASVVSLGESESPISSSNGDKAQVGSDVSSSWVGVEAEAEAAAEVDEESAARAAGLEAESTVWKEKD